jgi:hypothetical protein
VPDLRFNISHTDGLIACAVTIGREVGVDVETRRPSLLHDVAGRHFAPREVSDLRSLPELEQDRVFFDYWTLKEAYIKARGFGLALPLGDFAFKLNPPDAPASLVRAGLEDDPGDVAVPAGLADADASPARSPSAGMVGTCRFASARSCRRHERRRALWAISDLHVGYDENRRAVREPFRIIRTTG